MHAMVNSSQSAPIFALNGPYYSYIVMHPDLMRNPPLKEQCATQI